MYFFTRVVAYIFILLGLILLMIGLGSAITSLINLTNQSTANPFGAVLGLSGLLAAGGVFLGGLLSFIR